MQILSEERDLKKNLLHKQLQAAEGEIKARESEINASNAKRDFYLKNNVGVVIIG